jgi:hypothetical protein
MLLAELHFDGIQETGSDWFRSCLTDKRTEISLSSAIQNIFLQMGNNKTCSSPRVNSRVFASYTYK